MALSLVFAERRSPSGLHWGGWRVRLQECARARSPDCCSQRRLQTGSEGQAQAQRSQKQGRAWLTMNMVH